jgi:hypothetical protein
MSKDIWSRALVALDDGEWIDGEWKSPSPDGLKLIREALTWGQALEVSLQRLADEQSKLPEDD